MENPIEIELTATDLCEIDETINKFIEDYKALGKPVTRAEQNRFNLRGRCAIRKLLNLDCPLMVESGQKRNTAKMAGFYVRTLGKHHYDLVIDSNDQDDDLIALTTSEEPTKVKIHGWISVAEGKKIGKKRYFPATKAAVITVPQDKLNKFNRGTAS